MRIAQIVASLESRHGGPSRSVRGVASGLAALGHSVELLTTGEICPATRESTGMYSLRTFPRQFPRRFCASAPLSDHLRRSAYDVIHAHGLWLRPLHYAHTDARRNDVPLVISPRGMMSPWAWSHHRARKAFASAAIHPHALRGASGWHATSRAEANDIRRLGFGQPICVAPNGVICPNDEETMTSAAEWARREPGLSGRRVALFYSRFHAKKRVIELIDIWLSKPRGDWILLLVGIPEQYSVAQLEAYVDRSGGTGRVCVHDGTDQPTPYAAASLFLLPSHSENFGQVVAEALVHGLPVVTTDGTPWSALDEIGAGRCVSWDKYGETLDSLLKFSAEELRHAGERGRTWAQAEFSWSKAAGTLDVFYQNLLSSR